MGKYPWVLYLWDYKYHSWVWDNSCKTGCIQSERMVECWDLSIFFGWDILLFFCFASCSKWIVRRGQNTKWLPLYEIHSGWEPCFCCCCSLWERFACIEQQCHVQSNPVQKICYLFWFQMMDKTKPDFADFQTKKKLWWQVPLAFPENSEVHTSCLMTIDNTFHQCPMRTNFRRSFGYISCFRGWMHWAFEKWDEFGGVSNRIERVYNHWGEDDVQSPLFGKGCCCTHCREKKVSINNANFAS